MQLDEFEAIYQLATDFSGKAVSDGFVAAVYTSLMQMNPPPAFSEATDGICAWIDGFSPDQQRRTLSGKELRDIIRDRRPKATVLALPAPKLARNVDPEQLAIQARQNKIALMRGIYKHQGDTAFYRKMLGNRGGVWSNIFAELPSITHEEVLHSIEQQEGVKCIGLR